MTVLDDAAKSANLSEESGRTRRGEELRMFEVGRFRDICVLGSDQATSLSEPHFFSSAGWCYL